MINWKDCIVPIGVGVVKPPPKPPKPPRRKKVPVKCSTCANGKCRQRGSVCDWTHCGKWRERK